MAVNILSKHRVENKIMYVNRQTVALSGLTAMALGLALTFGAGDAAAQNKRAQAKNTNKIGILTVPPKAERAKGGTRQIVVESKPKNQRIAPPKAPRVEKPSTGKPSIAKLEIPKAERPKAKTPVVTVASAPSATKIVEEKVEKKIEEPIKVAPKKTVKKKKKIHKKRYHRYGYNHYDRYDGYHRGYKRGYDRGYRHSGYYSAPRSYRRSYGSYGGYERCH